MQGKWDENGFADADIAAKYPHVNAGDYIYWNPITGSPVNNSIYDKQIEYTSIQYPNKVLIHGGTYEKITLFADGLNGVNTKKPIVITNFLGQVYLTDAFSIRKSPNNIRITGQYDPVNGYGHRHFVGCDKNGSSVDFTYAHGTFGFLADQSWYWEINGTGGGHAYVIDNGNAKGVEIDHIEATNGFFSGLNWKWNNNFAITDSNRAHHLFFHDLGSEGLYQGSTSGSLQQLFRNFVCENSVFLRIGGEGIQTGRIMDHSRIENNVSFCRARLEEPIPTLSGRKPTSGGQRWKGTDQKQYSDWIGSIRNAHRAIRTHERGATSLRHCIL
ncbi:MAG: hypothetical protein U5L96_10860 [Owenweeksia sp.]|nr:hypothetical protein [Owenweeksia sp.]